MGVSVFFFVFHAKSGTANNYRIGLSDRSDKNPVSRNSYRVEKFPINFLNVEKKPFEIFQVKRARMLTIAYFNSYIYRKVSSDISN